MPTRFTTAVAPLNSRSKRAAIEDIGLDNLDRRQQDQVFCRFAPARRHDDFISVAGKSRHQMASDKAAAAHDHHTLRGRGHSVFAMGSTTTAPRGATVPRRAVSDTGEPPNACE